MMDSNNNPHLPSELNFLTLNCWGLKHLSKLRSQRLAEIGRHLAAANPPPHVVALQECWCEEDYRAIRRETRNVLPYGKRYHAGAFGAGLVILSRWPIEESSMTRFSLSGRPTAFFRGDWFVGKGAACAAIRFGPGPRHVVHVVCTHLHADYHDNGPDRPDSYACHRAAQAWEVAKIVRAAAERGHLVVAMGDFNMLPMSPAYRLLTAHAPVRDAWRLLHPDSSLGPPLAPPELARGRAVPDPNYNVAENGVTSNSILNTWSWTSSQRRRLAPDKDPLVVPLDSLDSRAKRIDYVFAGYLPSTPSPATRTGNGNDHDDGVWAVSDARVGMTARHPESGVSLSDHFSVEVTLRFVKPSPPPLSSTPDATAFSAPATTTTTNTPSSTKALTVDDSAFHNGAFLQTNSPTVSDFRGSESRPGFDHYPNPTQYHLTVGPNDAQFDFPGSAYDEVLSMLHQYTDRERRQRHWRAVHFFASLVVSAACLVAVCFSPQNWVAFLLMLLCSLLLTAGTIDGLLALLFFGSELRALTEFEWELMNAKAAALGGMGLATRDGTGET